MRFTRAFLAGLVIASFATAASADIPPGPRPRPRPPAPAPDPASLSGQAPATVKITGSAASDIAKLAGSGSAVLNAECAKAPDAASYTCTLSPAGKAGAGAR
jgi:hypothetical protein